MLINHFYKYNTLSSFEDYTIEAIQKKIVQRLKGVRTWSSKMWYLALQGDLKDSTSSAGQGLLCWLMPSHSCSVFSRPDHSPYSLTLLSLHGFMEGMESWFLYLLRIPTSPSILLPLLVHATLKQ
jgi:hypothetical protein